MRKRLSFLREFEPAEIAKMGQKTPKALQFPDVIKPMSPMTSQNTERDDDLVKSMKNFKRLRSVIKV